MFFNSLLAEIGKTETMTVEDILRGNLLSAARFMRRIEDGDDSARDDVRLLAPHAGRAHIIGVTGSPGTGKSTLLDRLIGAFRERGKTVGVVVIDPTSPFTGGALLGDRLRMQRHTSDRGVFIRSLATRGSLGGLTESTYDIVTVLDAMGKEVIIIETVGTGQDEVDIADLAHTNLVVTIPGLGDGIQAIKAGILESGSIFVVNKADLPESDIAVRQLEAMLDMRSHDPQAWKPVVVATSPLCNRGIGDLLDRIDAHKAYLESGRSDSLKARQLENRFYRMLRDRLFRNTLKRLKKTHMFPKLLEDVRCGRTDLYRAIDRIMADEVNGADS